MDHKADPAAQMRKIVPKTKPVFLYMAGKDKTPAPKAVDIKVKVDPLKDPGVIGENVLSIHDLSIYGYKTDWKSLCL